MHDPDNDYFISIEDDTLIIACIMSRVWWSPVEGINNWERELEEENSESVKQYFIQDKTKIHVFDSEIQCVQILSKRRILVGEADKFSVYSILNQSVVQEIPSNFIGNFMFTSIGEVHQTQTELTAD